MDERVRKVMDVLHSSFNEELTIEDIARIVNLSPSHLTRLFRTETGFTPFQYLKSLRMREAKELLETTFLNIKQIMNKVGVKDKCHFAQDFKRTYGVTPAQYKRTILQKLNRLPND